MKKKCASYFFLNFALFFLFISKAFGKEDRAVFLLQLTYQKKPIPPLLCCKKVERDASSFSLPNCPNHYFHGANPKYILAMIKAIEEQRKTSGTILLKKKNKKKKFTFESKQNEQGNLIALKEEKKDVFYFALPTATTSDYRIAKTTPFLNYTPYSLKESTHYKEIFPIAFLYQSLQNIASAYYFFGDQASACYLEGIYSANEAENFSMQERCCKKNSAYPICHLLNHPKFIYEKHPILLKYDFFFLKKDRIGQKPKGHLLKKNTLKYYELLRILPALDLQKNDFTIPGSLLLQMAGCVLKSTTDLRKKGIFFDEERRICIDFKKKLAHPIGNTVGYRLFFILNNKKTDEQDEFSLICLPIEWIQENFFTIQSTSNFKINEAEKKALLAFYYSAEVIKNTQSNMASKKQGRYPFLFREKTTKQMAAKEEERELIEIVGKIVKKTTFEKKEEKEYRKKKKEADAIQIGTIERANKKIEKKKNPKEKEKKQGVKLSWSFKEKEKKRESPPIRLEKMTLLGSSRYKKERKKPTQKNKITIKKRILPFKAPAEGKKLSPPPRISPTGQAKNRKIAINKGNKKSYFMVILPISCLYFFLPPSKASFSEEASEGEMVREPGAPEESGKEGEIEGEANTSSKRGEAGEAEGESITSLAMKTPEEVEENKGIYTMG